MAPERGHRERVHISARERRALSMLHVPRPPEGPSRSCGKRRYADQVTAELVLARIWRRGLDHGAGLPRRAYACEECHGWHLTSQPLSARRPEPPAPAPSPPPLVPPPPPLSFRAIGVLFQGLESWIAGYVAEFSERHRHGRGPTPGELGARFGWGAEESAAIAEQLVRAGWLVYGRPVPASRTLLPGPRHLAGPRSADAAEPAARDGREMAEEARPEAS